MSRSSSSTRSEPREVAELRSLAERQPELADAALMQIDLLDTQRRVQSRISTPWSDVSDDRFVERLARGECLAEFERLPIDWNELRLLVRLVTDVLRRHDAIDQPQAAQLHELGRDSRLPEFARRWFGGNEDRQRDAPPWSAAENTDAAPAQAPEMLDEVLRWAMRPFLARTAEVLQRRVGFELWGRGTCPVCGGTPDFSVITSTGERHLVCGRCQARWPFASTVCPFCGEANRDHLASFATPDGIYRVMACRTCQRYIKALDGRRAGRPVLPAVDTIATLPLDAVVMQKGYSNG